MAWSQEKLRSLALPPDTAPEAAWVQLEVYRRMTPEKRLLLALEINDSARTLCAAGVRARHPEFGAEQVRLAVIRLCLGDELFRKAFPEPRQS